MPDLAAEYHAAAERVGQVHLDHIKGLGVTGHAMAALWRSEGFAPFGIATIEPRPDGTFVFGPGPAHILQPVTYQGQVVDLVAWRSMTPDRWLTRMGSAWCLGEDHLYANSDSLTDPHRPTAVATPLDWLRAAGEAFCILDWDAQDVRGLVVFDAIRCANRILERTLVDAISKPVRLPRIIRTEALANVA